MWNITSQIFFLKKRTLLKFKMFLFKLSSAQYPKITNLKKKNCASKEIFIIDGLQNVGSKFHFKNNTYYLLKSVSSYMSL